MNVGIQANCLQTFIRFTRQKSGKTMGNQISANLTRPSERIQKFRQQLKKLNQSVSRIKSEARNFSPKFSIKYSVAASPARSIAAQANLTASKVNQLLK